MFVKLQLHDATDKEIGEKRMNDLHDFVILTK